MREADIATDHQQTAERLSMGYMRFLFVITVATIPVLPITTHAAVIFFEDFESSSGTTPLCQSCGAFNTSEREAGMYYGGITVPGWALSAPGASFVHVGISGNNSLLLNEGAAATISRAIGGLVIGQSHRLEFEYWGDNSGAGSLHNFLFEINGAVTNLSRASTGLGTGNFGAYTYDFIATSTSTLLRFTETGANGPHLDNILVSSAVPEPGTIALLGMGLAGLGFARKRRLAKY